MRYRRREFILALSGAAVATAGCIGDDGPEGSPGEGPTESDDISDDPAEAENGESRDGTPIPNNEAFDFPPPEETATAPEEMNCIICGMRPADPDFEHTAQAVHSDEHRQFTCSPGCMVAYTLAPEQFADTDEPIDTVWVRDVPTTELHEFEEFYWVLDTSPDDRLGRGVEPMRNPLPYLDRADAVEYVEQWDDLDEDDIVRSEDLDRDIAGEFRRVE